MLVFDRRYQPIHVTGIGNIAVEDDNLAGASYLMLQRDQLVMAARRNDHRISFFHKPERNGSSDAGACPGDPYQSMFGRAVNTVVISSSRVDGVFSITAGAVSAGPTSPTASTWPALSTSRPSI